MLKIFLLSLCVALSLGASLKEPSDLELEEDFGVNLEEDFASLQSSFVNEHNKWRQKEGAGLPSVSWDAELARQAEANVRQCTMRHDVRGKSTSQFKYIGQNLYMTSLKDIPADQAAAKSLAAWMSEKKDYNYGSNSCSRVCGHYTQVVWKSSTSIGCAVSRGCSGGTFVACNYGPAGNFIGKKPY